MENDNFASHNETLGTYLRGLRIEKSLELSDVSEETRIPQKTILAIEADDYKNLPAQAFAKGFYILYAKLLEVDHKEVLRRYEEERSQSYEGGRADRVSLPNLKNRRVGVMAERPTTSPGSIISFIALLIIIAGVGISWYAGYNPATTISKWLRGLQETSIQADRQPAESLQNGIEIPPPLPEASETSETAEENLPEQAKAPIPEDVKYQLVVEFMKKTTVKISLDDEEMKAVNIPSGTIRTWQANRGMVLELPEDASARLFLNGIKIPLPSPADQKIRIAIPEYLLD